jgi:hypothetical protein
MEVSHKLARVNCSTERVCYLVSDEEWNELVCYAMQFNFQEYSVPIRNASTMQLAGLQIIKRSALNQMAPEQE